MAPYTLGEMAHICGDRVGSNRHDPSQSDAERNDYANLILLCPTHHRLIDRKENEAAYPVDWIQAVKLAHELKVLSRLETISEPNKHEIASSIAPLVEENRISWLQYGPMSEIARTEPYNEAAHAVWLSERLSVIVPNNRNIASQLGGKIGLFDPEERPVVASFLLHARTYQQWVDDRIPYSAVARFPLNFEQLIRRLSSASA